MSWSVSSTDSSFPEVNLRGVQGKYLISSILNKNSKPKLNCVHSTAFASSSNTSLLIC